MILVRVGGISISDIVNKILKRNYEIFDNCLLEAFEILDSLSPVSESFYLWCGSRIENQMILFS